MFIRSRRLRLSLIAVAVLAATALPGRLRCQLPVSDAPRGLRTEYGLNPLGLSGTVYPGQTESNP